MKVTGFYSKAQAETYQKEHGGRVLWGQWSSTYGTFTDIGKAYHKALHESGIPLVEWDSKYCYIVTEEDK